MTGKGAPSGGGRRGCPLGFFFLSLLRSYPVDRVRIKWGEREGGDGMRREQFGLG